MSAWDVWRSLERNAGSLVCPITRQVPPLRQLVLASDGHVYDVEALRAWVNHTPSTPPKSPMTGHILRPWAEPPSEDMIRQWWVQTEDEDEGEGEGEGEAPLNAPVVLYDARRPLLEPRSFEIKVRVGDWGNSPVAVGLRTLLEWDVEDTVRIAAPFDRHEMLLLTPPPVEEFVPLFQRLASHLKLAYRNPEHIGTAWWSTDDGATWSTLEERVLDMEP